ncbi:MAG: molybdopterin-containing oxidoreductase family protein [Thermoanaerobaculia bacterium]
MTRKNGFSRRSFIRNSSLAAAAGLSLTPFDRLFADAFGRLLGTADDIRKVVSACGFCDSACGLTATLKNGTLAFVEGHAADLNGGGKMCGKGKAAAGFVYDPDRLKYPMKRTNPVKGIGVDPGWVRISWEEALDTTAAKLQETVAQHGADSVLFLSRAANDLFVRYMNAVGTPNRVDHADECFLTNKIVSSKMLGGMPWCHDFANSSYILLFGWDLVAKSKVVFTRAVAEAKRRGAKIVHFSPNRTATSNIADEWYPIRPGSDLAVALAMIHVIVKEKLYDTEFVNTYTDYPTHESEILAHFEQYTPQWAESLSDIKAADIARIAREFALTRPGIVPMYKKALAANYANAAALQQALNMLNILNGSIDRPGGRFFPRGWAVPGVDKIFPPPAYPPKSGVYIDGRDKHPFIKASGNGMFSTLAHGMLVDHPDKIKMAVVWKYTTMSFANPPRIAEALAKVPFTVVIEVLPNEVIDLADIVLPESTCVESAAIATRDMHAWYPQVYARKALVAPMFETKGLGWIAIELGKRNFPDYFKKPDGTFFTGGEVNDAKCKAAGLGDNFADFLRKDYVEKVQPFVPKTKFPTSDGKLHIWVQDFKDKGFEPLPAWAPKRDQPSTEYPFYLITQIPSVHIRNSTINNALLNEVLGTNHVQINPVAAKRLGITEGAPVKLTSRVGSITLPARITGLLREDCVSVYHGFGHRSRLLTRAGGKGERDSDLVPDQSMADILARKDPGGSGAIMDAVFGV